MEFLVDWVATRYSGRSTRFHDGVDNLVADITDLGQMFNVLSSYANFDELEPGRGVPSFDAVVHFAAVPRILINPDNETFRVNTMGTYNVIEAAVKMGIKKIVIASSETTYGSALQTVLLTRTVCRMTTSVFRNF